VLPYYLTGQVSSFYALPLQNIMDIKSVIARFLSVACEHDRIRGLYEFVSRGLFQQLYQQIDQAKVELSTHDAATIRFAVPPYLAFDETIMRSEFDAIISPRIEAIEQMINEVLADTGIAASAIDFVVLVGGSTQIPAVQSLLHRLFPGRIHQGNTFASIAAGLLDAYRQGLGIAG
jgi:cell division ATPase FtsA